jgi:multisubunit Na+/H+ antiporter MnhF subunit
MNVSPSILAMAADRGVLRGATGAHGSPPPLPATRPPSPLEESAELVLFAVVDVGIVLMFASLGMVLYRVLKGPTLVDRAIGSDTSAVLVVTLVILMTIRLDTLVAFDAVLIVSILGFVSTVAVTQFIGRRRSVQ